MDFNFKEALQDTISKLKESFSAEGLAVKYLQDFNEKLSLTKVIFEGIKKINFAMIRVKSSEYLLHVNYTNPKGEIKNFNFDTRRWYKDKKEANAIFNALKEKIKKDGLKICESDFPDIDWGTLEDSFSIEIE